MRRLTLLVLAAALAGSCGVPVDSQPIALDPASFPPGLSSTTTTTLPAEEPSGIEIALFLVGENGRLEAVDRSFAATVTTQGVIEALIAAADLVICPDSGPAHMATAAGTPVIGLYATSNPNRTGPYLSRHLTVNRYPDAVRKYLGSDVDQLRWGQRVRHPDAMDLITIRDVTDKIDDFFAN